MSNLVSKREWNSNSITKRAFLEYLNGELNLRLRYLDGVKYRDCYTLVAVENVPKEFQNELETVFWNQEKTPELTLYLLGIWETMQKVDPTNLDYTL